MTRLRGGRWHARTALAAAGLLSAALVMIAGPASADDQAGIDHVTATKDGAVQILVSVPGTDPIRLDSVGVTIDGKKVAATAANASDRTDVRRTAVLAIDTSNSMRGVKFEQAKAAALSYLDVVPADVYVGLVTFDKTVRVLTPPTLDRSVMPGLIEKLTLARATALNAGVLKAISISGTEGSRNVLVLSDGKDTTKTPLSQVTDGVKTSGVKVDVVALQQSGAGLQGLTSIADAGHGSVIRADDPSVLKAAFQAEANTLARQVLVTATVPAGKRTDGNITVAISDSAHQWSGSAYSTIRLESVVQAHNQIAPPVTRSGIQIPAPLVGFAIALIGFGVVGVVATMVLGESPNKRNAMAEQIANYGANAKAAKGKREAEAASFTARATKQAAAVLANNRGLEAKIAGRLDGAAISLKPAEWLLVHASIALGLSLVLLVLADGNPVLMVFGLIIGSVLPWIWLGFKKKRRIKAFKAALPDTLQLMAGSMSAGLSLAQSVDTIVREGGEPITSEFRRVIVESRLGVPVEDAMDGVARRMDSRDFEWVVMAIRIQREVGGNLSELLLTVAETLREREFIRRHVQALSAEGRLSCYVLGGLPPAFLGYLALSKWDYVKPLFTTPIGFVLCGALCLLLSVGIFWMAKVSKVEL